MFFRRLINQRKAEIEGLNQQIEILNRKKIAIIAEIHALKMEASAEPQAEIKVLHENYNQIISRLKDQLEKYESKIKQLREWVMKETFGY